MRKAGFIAAIVFGATALTGCSAFQGTMGKTVEEFEDGHGRVCTSVKWGESASVDCDFAPEK